MVMIFVKLFTGYTQTLYVEPSDSIDSIKDLLYCNCGMPLDLQRLVFAGELLEDGRAFSTTIFKTKILFFQFCDLQINEYLFRSNIPLVQQTILHVKRRNLEKLTCFTSNLRLLWFRVKELVFCFYTYFLLKFSQGRSALQ